MEKTLQERFWEMKFGLLRSFYYYESRLLFWCMALTTFYIFNAFAGILALLEIIPYEWKFVGGAMVALGGSTLEGHKRIKTLRIQKRAMGDCLAEIPYREKDETEKQYRLVKGMREKAERKDEVLFETLDAMCHNKACMTLGVAERYRISALRAFWGWWLPIPYPKDMKPDLEETDGSRMGAIEETIASIHEGHAT